MRKKNRHKLKSEDFSIKLLRFPAVKAPPIKAKANSRKVFIFFANTLDPPLKTDIILTKGTSFARVSGSLYPRDKCYKL